MRSAERIAPRPAASPRTRCRRLPGAGRQPRRLTLPTRRWRSSPWVGRSSPPASSPGRAGRGTALGPLMIAPGSRCSCGSCATATTRSRSRLLRARRPALRAVAHAVLAYPSGRVTDRLERAFLNGRLRGRARVPARDPPLLRRRRTAALLRPGAAREPAPRLRRRRRRRGAPEGVRRRRYGVLATLFIALIVAPLVRATPSGGACSRRCSSQRSPSPLRAVFESVFTFVDRRRWSPTTSSGGRSSASSRSRSRCSPDCCELGSRARMSASSSSGLEQTPPAGHPRRARARARRPDARGRVLAPRARRVRRRRGAPVTLPEDRPHRAGHAARARRRAARGARPRPVAARRAEARRGCGRRPRLALENARLHAEVRGAAREGEESRARIVAAADEERRRIERDLHDGAQQRLVALALELGARSGDSARTRPEVERLLDVDGRRAPGRRPGAPRALARGIHPPILTQGGLAVALEALADRAPLPVTVAATSDRLPPEVEATAYFVASEALANVVKHAHASRRRSRRLRERERSWSRSADDGVGGANRATAAAGLRGSRRPRRGARRPARRREPAGGGTRVVGEIPCAS